MGLDNPLHIAFLLIVLLLVFGAKRLPEMGQSLGHGMRGFKDALSGESPSVELPAHHVESMPATPQQPATVSPAAAGAPTPIPEPVAAAKQDSVAV